MRFEFYSEGKLRSIAVQTLSDLTATPTRSRGRSAAASAARAEVKRSNELVSAAKGMVHSQSARLAPLMHSEALAESSTLAAKPQGDTIVLATPTVILQDATKAELKRLKSEFGMQVIKEGSHGKVLLRAPDGGQNGVEQAFKAAASSYRSGSVSLAHPNFLRVFRAPAPSAAGNQPLWNHRNDGNPGIPGADVAVDAAWTISRGVKDVRVAVLDEGVDTLHPALKDAVVMESDFVDSNKTARPSGNDAHGTACAGIILSRDKKIPGIAPESSLVAVRIAKGDGRDGWIFDDFNTADAIDWSWDDAKSDVLSNSWGGGPAVDVISRAFQRAQTRGRRGKGCVIVVAAGNSNSAVQYPAVLPYVLAVGASNAWDQRKSPSSKDGENWWGSCYGRELSLVAPGVHISTTDIHGAAGYSNDSFVSNFNGTSSACPHVAAAAALVLSVKPDLSESRVREIILTSVDRISASGRRTNELGEGRLNAYLALRLARRT